MIRVKGLIYVLCLLIAVASFACAKDEPDTIITGIVSDSSSGIPISNVKVEFKSGVVFSSSVIQQTVTDENGYYSIVYDTPDSKPGIDLSGEYVEVNEPSMTKQTARVNLGTSNKINLKPALIPSFVKVNFERINQYDSVKVKLTQEGRFPLNQEFTCGGDPSLCSPQVLRVIYHTEVNAEITLFRRPFSNSVYNSSYSTMANDTTLIIVKY
jgi:hypothetical protein